MSPAPEVRGLDDLVRADAPLPARRAVPLMVAVAREASRIDLAGGDPGPLTADRVRLAADGSVDLLEVAPPATGSGGARSCGASLGELLFELLTGRRPLGREDAYEPAIIDGLAPDVRALLARSLSGSPGQWPGPQEWTTVLERSAAGLAPPVPPREAARQQRRRVLLGLGVAVLAAASLVALLLAPRWLESLEEGSWGGDAPAAQVERTSS